MNNKKFFEQFTRSRCSLKNLFHCAALLFFIVCISFVSVDGQEDDEIINVESSIVVLNATVADSKGVSAGGLKQHQFKVYEDGQEQQIEFFEAEKTPFAAVILIDTSGSMEGSVSMARAAAINFLDGLREGDAAAIYNFDSKIALVQDFSNSRDIAERVFDLKADGMTALNDAIFKAATELGNRPEKRRAVVVLSDGADTQSRRSADKALKAALSVNATIYTIDMSLASSGSQKVQSQGALKNFAEKSGGKFLSTPGGVAMREAFKNIVEELGSQYTLAYQPANTKKDGKWRTIEIRVAKPNLTIRTRKGYHAPKTDKGK